MQAKYFAIFVAVSIFLFVVELIRKQKMTFRYSVFWLSACVFVLLFSIADHLLIPTAHFFGFTLPSNFVFFLVQVFFLFLSLFLTLYINEQNNRTDTLIQQVGILQFRVKQLEKEKGDGPPTPETN